ncbi:transposase [Actinokineospora spheciospongiae]|uniref:transposase n=1 Tax=Actinokineospora spheciospongiae TaxID=909613 RepID=UPI00190FBB96|nr:transposase [Actinokineospora spheciospongiae]
MRGTRRIPCRAIRAHLRNRGTTAVIPQPVDQIGHRRRRCSRGGRPPAFDIDDHRNRTVIGRCFTKLKKWRGIATRFDRLAIVYRAADVLHAMYGMGNTIRAILDTPRYTAFAVFGRVTNREILLESDDVVAGNATRFRRSIPDRVVRSRTQAHPEIVSVETFAAWMIRRSHEPARRKGAHCDQLASLSRPRACSTRLSASCRASRARVSASPPVTAHPPEARAECTEARAPPTRRY